MCDNSILPVRAPCFFKQKTAYAIGTGDWSSDVCSSDLALLQEQSAQRVGEMLLIDASENPEPETESNPWVEQWGTLLS